MFPFNGLGWLCLLYPLLAGAAITPETGFLFSATSKVPC